MWLDGGRMNVLIKEPEHCSNSLGHGTERSQLSMQRKSTPPEIRFWSKVTKTDSCWIWNGYRNPGGYGHFSLARGRTLMAHRFAYELLREPIPDPLPLDHLCRNRACVNPDHLEPVTPRENVLRGLSGRMVTHCPQGHEYTPENTRLSRGRRECRTCLRKRDLSRRDSAFWREYRKIKKGRALSG